MAKREPGNPRNIKRVSGEAYFRPAGGAGWISLGDITAHQLTHDIGRKTVLRPTRFGALTRKSDRITRALLSWDISVQEELQEIVGAQLFGAEVTAYSQAEGTDLGATLENVQPGMIYDLGKLMVSNVGVTEAGANRTEGLDYITDAQLGTLRIKETGVIAPGATLDVTFSCEAIEMHRTESHKAPQRNGTLRLIENDGQEDTPRAIIEFECSLFCDGVTEDSVERFGVTNLKAMATGPVSVRHRVEPGVPEYLLTEAGEYLTTEEGELLVA